MGSSDEAEVDSDAGSGDNDASAPASPLHAQPLAQVDSSTSILALHLVARLGCPFNALLKQQSNSQFKHIPAEYKIIVLGITYKMKPTYIKSKIV